MTFFNLFIRHQRSAEAEAWLQEEEAAQAQRYQQIARRMDELAPERQRWYSQFFARIQKRGFNVDGDQLVKVRPEDLPVQPPGRADQVLWEYGVDSDPQAPGATAAAEK